MCGFYYCCHCSWGHVSGMEPRLTRLTEAYSWRPYELILTRLREVHGLRRRYNVAVFGEEFRSVVDLF